MLSKLFFKNNCKVSAFTISRLHENELQETVFLKNGSNRLNISKTHGMICLDPFCIVVWLSNESANLTNLQYTKIEFIKNNTLNASITVSLIEKLETAHGALLLYKIKRAQNSQLTFLHRLLFFGYFLKSKSNTYLSRRIISALYSYPRSIIIVSYQDHDYCNIFPMDIHCAINEEGLYILGLRTTNVTLNKILQTKRVVVCDTNDVDINTVYSLGKHSSKAPTALVDMPFNTTGSEVFGFPIPDFVGVYKEIEIITHKKMGFHMMMVGRVINKKQIKADPTSLYHVGFLQSQISTYQTIDGLY